MSDRAGSAGNYVGRCYTVTRSTVTAVTLGWLNGDFTDILHLQSSCPTLQNFTGIVGARVALFEKL